MDAVTITGGRTPWHLWVVGIVALLWNGYGAYDYLMTQTNPAEHLAAFTPEQRAYFASAPAWMMAVWATGVWGGVLGALLLLLKRRWALPVFIISFAAFLVSVVYTYALSEGGRIMGGQSYVMNAVITAICIVEIVYARAMIRRGVLR